MDADVIGRVVLLLGGGRRLSTDTIDHLVGIDGLIKAGGESHSGRTADAHTRAQ